MTLQGAFSGLTSLETWDKLHTVLTSAGWVKDRDCRDPARVAGALGIRTLNHYTRAYQPTDYLFDSSVILCDAFNTPIGRGFFIAKNGRILRQDNFQAMNATNGGHVSVVNTANFGLDMFPSDAGIFTGISLAASSVAYDGINTDFFYTGFLIRNNELKLVGSKELSQEQSGDIKTEYFSLATTVTVGNNTRIYTQQVSTSIPLATTVVLRVFYVNASNEIRYREVSGSGYTNTNSHGMSDFSAESAILADKNSIEFSTGLTLTQVIGVTHIIPDTNGLEGGGTIGGNFSCYVDVLLTSGEQRTLLAIAPSTLGAYSF